MKRTNKGFTLAELLIVVAVIAVLVAVAIPTFNGQLEKSRQATDLANLRGAYAAAKIAEMNQEVAAYSKTDDSEVNPIKIGLKSSWANLGVDGWSKYSGVGYAFWYDADTGRLYPDQRTTTGATAQVAPGNSLTATDGNVIFTSDVKNVTGVAANAATDTPDNHAVAQTSLNAHSQKVVVDTSNLPGKDKGIIQYVANAETPENGDLPGSESKTWPTRKILVVFYNNDGVWELRQSSIRFTTVNTGVTIADTVGAGATKPYNGNLGVVGANAVK